MRKRVILKKILIEMATLAVGDKVASPFGVGTIELIRADGDYVVVHDNWHKEEGKALSLILGKDKISKVANCKATSCCACCTCGDDCGCDGAPAFGVCCGCCSCGPGCACCASKTSSAKATSAAASATGALKPGDTVNSPFGVGELLAVRDDGAHIVTLESWKLATGKSPVLYLNGGSISKAAKTVTCSACGTGASKGSSNCNCCACCQCGADCSCAGPIAAGQCCSCCTCGSACSCCAASTSGVKVGDQINTAYGKGTVTGSRASDNMVTITLDSWTLANGKAPVLHMHKDAAAAAAVQEVSSSVPSSSGSKAPVVLAPIQWSSYLAFGLTKLTSEDHASAQLAQKASGASWASYLARGLPITASAPKDEVSRRLESFDQRIKSSFGSVTVEPPTDDLKVGGIVYTMYGHSEILEFRQDGLVVSKLLNWTLANGKSPLLYGNKATLTASSTMTRVPQEASNESSTSTAAATFSDSVATPSPAVISSFVTSDTAPVSLPPLTTAPPVTDAPYAGSSSELSSAVHQEQAVVHTGSSDSGQRAACAPGCLIF